MELRQSVNSLEVFGTVKEADLQARTKVDAQGAQIEYITGKITLWISDSREITVSVPYVKKLNNNGDVTKRYQTLADFIAKKLPTMANLEEVKATRKAQAQQMHATDPQALEQALATIEALKPTCLNIWSSDQNFSAKLAANDFWSEKDSKVVEGKPKPEVGFANLTVKDFYKEEDFYAKGRIEMMVTNVQPEVKNGTETGNAEVAGYAVGYGSKVFPVTVVAGVDGDFSFAELCLSQLTPGATVIFFYDYMAGKTTVEVKENVNFGRGQVKVIETSYNYLHTMGGEIIEANAFDEDLMRQAVAVRKSTYFDEIKRKAEERSSQPAPTQQGFGGVAGFGGGVAGFGAPTPTAVPRPNPSSLF